MYSMYFEKQVIDQILYVCAGWHVLCARPIRKHPATSLPLIMQVPYRHSTQDDFVVGAPEARFC
jgi:hypothetical protein